MLQDILRADGARLTAHIHPEAFTLFNGVKGSFVRQMLRHHQPDPALRLRAIELEVEKALARQNVAMEDEVAVFCGMARVLGLPIPRDAAEIGALMADKAALAAFLQQAAKA